MLRLFRAVFILIAYVGSQGRNLSVMVNLNQNAAFNAQW